MRLGFLFGAGVSIHCGAPSTGELTEKVLDGEGVRRYSDGTYFLSAKDHPGLGDRDGLQRIRKLLLFLNEHAISYFRREKGRDRIPNYEDLYYLVTQLADAADEFENPAISGLLSSVQERFVEPPLPAGSCFPSTQLLDEARCYIRGVVSQSLASLRRPEGHLEQLRQAATDPEVSRLEIFSLNHDLLIERNLHDGRVRFCDGFVRASNDLRCWDGRKFASSTGKVRVAKLHGSIDWHAMRLRPGGPSSVCIATNGDIEHARGLIGTAPVLLRDNPLILIGTFNKMLEYSMGVFADLFCAFRGALSKLNRLVISGYSFGDKGVNATLPNGSVGIQADGFWSSRRGRRCTARQLAELSETCLRLVEARSSAGTEGLKL